MAIIREAARLGDQEFIIETGRMAQQANGAVMVQYGNSQVLCTATGGNVREGLDFFPLSVDYVENFWAAGMIPGGYFKREGKMSEKAVLTSRLIDRPCRPLFAKGYINETQLVAWVLSADRVNDTDVLGITGCSAALMLSDLPWAGPLAGVRIGLVDGKFVANPTFEQRERSELDIVLAISQEAIVMVEGEAREVSEQVMIDALAFGREAVKDVLALQIELARQVGKTKREVVAPVLPEDIVAAMKKFLGDKMNVAMQVPEKMARYAAVDALKAEAQASLNAKFPGQEKDVSKAFSKFQKQTLRGLVANEGVRVDGRKPHEIRPISCEVGLIPCAHGSALFTRGETQALATVTLGTEKAAQRLEGLEGDSTRSFMLHYNFPPFSVGEVKPMRGPGRREIGHGHLALRGLTQALPEQKKEFPYTIRVVSDVMGSNGSSSMATVCGGSLAMMDAGVPLKCATAGIAMGLIKEGDKVVVLSDILGDEDFLGDMDFKVCGTSKGITAFQMDTKIGGIADETMKKALSQARSGIAHILGEMAKALSEPRKDLSATAPRITKIKIPTDAIGAVIGQGGKTIRSIQETTGTTISIEDDGTVSIAASNGVAAAQAMEIIKGLTQEPEVGTVYLGTVKKIVEFGAFVEILPGKEGLCHISELTEGRVNRVEDILREGDECLVKLIGTERGGKLRLSRKEALAERAAAEGADGAEG
jgi:polyribonucleotide nucleotidyltransferase